MALLTGPRGHTAVTVKTVEAGSKPVKKPVMGARVTPPWYTINLRGSHRPHRPKLSSEDFLSFSAPEFIRI